MANSVELHINLHDVRFCELWSNAESGMITYQEITTATQTARTTTEIVPSFSKINMGCHCAADPKNEIV